MNANKVLPLAAGLLLAGSAQVQAATLLHHYDFTSGVTDSAGSANGTLLGDASTAGGVLTLDGDGDYVQFSSNLVPTGGSYSVSFFAARAVVQGSHTEVISQAYSGGGFYVGTDPSGTIRAGDGWLSTGVSFGTPGVTDHYALTVDAGSNTSRLYVNGTLAASVNYALTSASGGTYTRFGRQFDPYSEYFQGTIDDMRIYDGALTGNEVFALANAVPEPSTYTMLAAGLGLVGALARRRRSS
jgi:hypothetical protein